MHQVPIVVVSCTKYEQNQPFVSEISQQTHKIYNMYCPRITQIWHRAKCYFTCISHTWYLITVQNMNKINLFFSEISHQIHKMYEKVAINYSNLAQSQMLFHKHEQCMLPDNGTKYEQNHHILR